jgi:hypothetical protein
VDQLVADASRASQGWLRVSGRAQRTDGTVDVAVRLADGRLHQQRIAVSGARALDGGLVAHAWADARMAAYAADPVAHRDAMRTLSRQFGLVGPDTSLLVLETLDDYLRYGIRAPAPLREAYDRLHAVRIDDEAQARRHRLDQIARQTANAGGTHAGRRARRQAGRGWRSPRRCLSPQPHRQRRRCTWRHRPATWPVRRHRRHRPHPWRPPVARAVSCRTSS